MTIKTDKKQVISWAQEHKRLTKERTTALYKFAQFKQEGLEPRVNSHGWVQSKETQKKC